MHAGCQQEILSFCRTLRVSFVLPLRAKRKLHPLVGTFDFQPGSHPVSTLRFHIFSGTRLPFEPGSLFLPAGLWTRLAVSLSAGRIPGHPSHSGYCQSQRHGSADPTPCGGYAGPDCCARYLISDSTSSTRIVMIFDCNSPIFHWSV